MSPSNSVTEKAKLIKLLILDVDGVFTDGRIWISGEGTEYKMFNTQDGYGLKTLRRQGIQVAVITGRKSSAVTYRMKELGIEHVFQDIRDKLAVFKNLLKDLALEATQCAYVGDDNPDIPVMQQVGLKVAVENATAPVKSVADYETSAKGGHGAIREVCDMILAAQQLTDISYET